MYRMEYQEERGHPAEQALPVEVHHMMIHRALQICNRCQLLQVIDGNCSRVCTISKLEPASAYRFRVRVEIGTNQWSKPSEWTDLVQLGQRTFYLI